MVHDIYNVYFWLFSFNPDNFCIKLTEQIGFSLLCKGELPEATRRCNFITKEEFVSPQSGPGLDPSGGRQASLSPSQPV